MSTKMQMSMEVNGEARDLVVEPRTTLADALREECGLTGTRTGCEEGICGACTVLVDGEPVRACLQFAVQAHGREVTTIEGVREWKTLEALKAAMREHFAVQCGFCTSGFLMLAAGALTRKPEMSAAEIAEVAEMNLCRCTGYQPIVRAMQEAQASLKVAAQ
ncbi:(2Fe-2S)-binding protein [Stappia sp. 22II-S9-Z10]|nr:(2Fe-2S)-binding protein [Stappia sp. 22II-S9-Z10]